jgi:hypothetical protein
VERAPYDPFITHEAAQAFVRDLPPGERTTSTRLRACDILYGRMLDVGRRIFLDKSPANALVLPFLTKLTRGRASSLAPPGGDHRLRPLLLRRDFEVAQRHNPLLDRYVPAIARVPPRGSAPLARAARSSWKPSPRYAGSSISSASPSAGNHRVRNRRPAGEGGLGDPISVARHTRPVTESVDRWGGRAGRRSEKLAFIRTDRAPRSATSPPGYRGTIFDPLARATGRRPPGPRLTRYALERKILVALRRNIHHNALGRILKRLRFALDVLLRD